MKTILIALILAAALWASPTVGALTPNGGTNTTQTFTQTFTEPTGGAHLNMIAFLVTPYSVFSGASACFVIYYPQANLISMYNDAGTALLATLTPGQAGQVNNSQCTLFSLGVTKAINGNALTVTLPITFNASWAGLKTIFGYAQNDTNLNSGWVQVGSWSIVAPPTNPVISALQPASGTGLSQTFVFTIQDPTDGNNIDEAILMVGSDISLPHFAQHACAAVFFPVWNAISLYSDDASTLLTPALTPGQPGTLSNSQCTISGLAAAKTITGKNAILTIPMTFKNTWTGPQYIYQYAHTLANHDTGWVQAAGLWTVPSSTTLTVGPITAPDSPALAGTFTYRIESNALASNMGQAYLRIGTTNQFTAASVCDMNYDPINDWLYLTNDAGTGTAGYGHPGQAPTFGVMSNSQCSFSLSAVVVSRDTSELAVTVPLTFTSAFSGVKTLWVFGNPGNLNTNPTGWQNKGTWTVGTLPAGQYASMTITLGQPGAQTIDDYSGQTVTTPTSSAPFAAVRLRDGSTVNVHRADNITVARMGYKNEPAGQKYAYHFTIDSRQVYMIRLGEVQDNGLAEGATQENPKGWARMGGGWAELGDKTERAEDSVFSVTSKWKPGLLPIYLAGQGMKILPPYSPKTDDNERIAAVASIFNNSVQKFVIGPAIPPDATQDTLDALTKRWVEDFGFGFLRPIVEGKGFDAVTPSTDLERDALKCLKDATAALSRK